MDGRDADALVWLFTADGIIEGTGASWQGHKRLHAIVAWWIERYASTLHTVRNQTVATRMDMGIRYRDSFVRQDGLWLFASRRLIVD